MGSQGQMIKELWRLFLRQLKVLIGVGAVGVIITGFIAYILPPVYVSQAKILVEDQQIPDALARTTVTTAASERLQLIRQRLMTRDNLIKVIDNQQLFANRSDLTISEKIDLLRQATRFRQINLANRNRRNQPTISAFTISVRLSNPRKASGVANEFVTNVLSLNIRTRAEQASDTLDFFRNEEKRLGDSLAALEVEVSNFKQENASSMPENIGARRAELARMGEREFDLDSQLLKMRESASTLKLRIAAYDQGQSNPSGAISAEEAEIRRLEATLAQKRAVFSESHREVRALKAQIKALEGVAPDQSVRADNGQTISVERATMQNQLALVQTQIGMAQKQREALGERRESIRAALDAAPEVELKLGGMNRRLEELRSRLAVIVTKRAAAETGERLEVNQQAERFEVIENALVPDKPVSPDRQKIFMLGSGVSFAIAGALAFLLEILNPALRSAAQMERALDLRPVATIPYIRTRREIATRRFKFGLIALAILAGPPILLFLVDTYYLPLQLVIEKVIDQAGLGEIVRSVEDRF